MVLTVDQAIAEARDANPEIRAAVRRLAILRAARAALAKTARVHQLAAGHDPVRKPRLPRAPVIALGQGVHSADVVLNILARKRDPGPAAIILTPATLSLRHAPAADCARYDSLRMVT